MTPIHRYLLPLLILAAPALAAALGAEALSSNTTGSLNSAFGAKALLSNTTGSTAQGPARQLVP